MEIKDTKLYYNRFTDIYLKYFGNNFQVYSPDNIKSYLNDQMDRMDIKNGMELLDIGCGVCGTAIYFAKKKNVFIDCINISDYQIDLAKNNIRESKSGNKINIYEMDYHSLNYDLLKDKYDIIYFFESLGHTLKYKSVIEGVNTLVKKNGVLYIKDLFSLNHDNTEDESISQLREEYFHYKPIVLHELLESLYVNNFKIEFIKNINLKLNNKKIKNFIEELGLPDGGRETGYWLEIKAIKY